ncbi:MAG: hypothetical protein SGI83_10730 [Bacteroidota bacterium]|nr:hypothetical protein [Bacteroidota bacterium]
MKKIFSLKQLLWIDGIAALLAGVIILLFSSRLSPVFNLPENLLMTQAIITLLYSSYSISMARRKSNPKQLIYILVIANFAYVLLVSCLVVYFFRTATIYGIIYLIAEVLFIGLLAFLEWRRIK